MMGAPGTVTIFAKPPKNIKTRKSIPTQTTQTKKVKFITPPKLHNIPPKIYKLQKKDLIHPAKLDKLQKKDLIHPAKLEKIQRTCEHNCKTNSAIKNLYYVKL